MKVEIKEVENTIDWAKSQVVVGVSGTRVLIVTNQPSTCPGCFCGVNIDNGNYNNKWIKHDFKPETKQDFPIKLELTIESEQEFLDLYKRVAIGKRVLNDSMSLMNVQCDDLSSLPLLDALQIIRLKIKL